MTRTTTVCPHCDRTRVYRRGGGISTENEFDWHCRDCGKDFDEPRRRDAESDGGIRNDTLASKLEAASPGEVAR